MKDKLILITGATNGIGKETALSLARMGAKLVLTARNREKGHRIVDEIKAKTGNENIEMLYCDLSSMQDVRRMAEEFNAKHKKLDVLVNNAGVMMQKKTMTKDGFEHSFAVNHLSVFYLTNLLLDTIKKASPSRIVNVSSAAHKVVKIDFNNLMAEQKFSPMSVYGQSKLANILFTVELSDRLKGSGVTVNCLHPGVVRTGIAGNSNLLFRTLFAIAKPFFISPSQGAATSIFLASSAEVEGISGKYFVKSKLESVAAHARDKKTAEKLWKISMELVGLS